MSTAQEGVQGIPATMNLYAIGVLLISANSVFMLAFLCALFEGRLPKTFYVFATISFSAWAIAYLLPYAEASRWIRLFHLLLAPGIWYYVTVQAIRRKESGAILIGLGVVLWSINPLNSFLREIGYAPKISFSLAIVPAVSLINTFLFSVYLARQFARTNRNLETQLEQVLHLSKQELEHERERTRHAEVAAENERRAAELEEARQLQLSLLPKRLPNLPHPDIAAYMKTASEVGGDYYDFHLGEDGTLTIAVGDATGHGLKAGTLVSSVKSLFVSLAYHPDIPHIFDRISRVLKEMKLRGLFMAMTMVKINCHRMIVSMAGMPPVLLYRAATGVIEDVAMRALPLGGVTKYQYQQQEVMLATNDVVVLMSDGLPERFNPNGEMLDDERIRAALPAVATQSSEAIIAALVRLGEEWSEGRAQDDDITFVVLRVRDV